MKKEERKTKNIELSALAPNLWLGASGGGFAARIKQAEPRAPGEQITSLPCGLTTWDKATFTLLAWVGACIAPGHGPAP